MFQWFNEANSCQISSSIEEALFGTISSSQEERIKNIQLHHLNYASLYIFL